MSFTEKRFFLNGKEIVESLPDGLVLLDYLRRTRRLTGTKEGCREGDCGACSVLVGSLENGRVRYRAVNSCLFPMAKAHGIHIVTIEGLDISGSNPLFAAFVDEHASQCGFCTPGIIVALTGYFLSSEHYSANGAVRALDGNICRCTGYASIKKAAGSVCDILNRSGAADIRALVEHNVVPPYFLSITEKLNRIPSRPVEPTDGPLVGGGTDLFVQQPEALLETELRTVSKSLTPVREDNGRCIIDGAATATDLLNSTLLKSLFPDLERQLLLVSSTPIRNEATVAGNIVNASPIADLTILLLALNSTLTLIQGDKKRTVPLSEFFLDYKKIDLSPGEIISAISFAIPKQPFYFNFEKVSKRTYLDIASVNSAALIETDNGRIVHCTISAGGVAPVPLVLTKTSHYLIGKPVSRATLRGALAIIPDEISPISDVRGSARYKSRLLTNLVAAHFFEFFPQFQNKEVLA